MLLSERCFVDNAIKTLIHSFFLAGYCGHLGLLTEFPKEMKRSDTLALTYMSEGEKRLKGFIERLQAVI